MKRHHVSCIQRCVREDNAVKELNWNTFQVNDPPGTKVLHPTKSL